MIRRTLIVALYLFASIFAFNSAAIAASNPGSAKTAKIVDQGTFAIFQNGHQVATETFTIRQYQDSSVTSSQFHDQSGQGGNKLEQTGELTLFPNGTLSRYEWKQKVPPSSAVVEPQDQFLVMHSVVEGRTTNLPFFLTPDVFVLDDSFFSFREVFLWRYLAGSCTPRPNGDGCDLQRTRFPILVPRRHTSAEVFLEFKGYDDLPLNGRPQHLRHFLLQSDGPEWHLWLDNDHKLQRISIPDTNTEVLRQEPTTANK